MRKFSTTLYFLIMAVFVLSLSGCNGNSNSFSGSTSKPEVKQVAVLNSPVFQQGSNYQMYKGASVNIDGAKYYVAPGIGTEDGSSTLNLGFTEKLDESLVIVNASTDQVVFAYNPSGSGDKTTGTVTFDKNANGGKILKYDGLTITQASFTSLPVNTSSRKVIVLDASTGKATIDGEEVPEHDYVWHAEPDYYDEYFTLGSSSTEKLTKKQVKAAISDAVYVARDIRYTPNTISFTGTAVKDEDTEYVAYYSDEVAAEMKAEYGDDFAGPYIFATLPQSGGMGGVPGGNIPGGMNSNNRPNFPGGNGTPQNFRTSAISNSDIAAFSTMTHSASEAYANRVLHITEAGNYELQGTWKGQIWIEIGEESTDKAAIILNNVTVSCDVAPALVFKEVYEGNPSDGDDEEDVALVASNWKTLGTDVLENAGAMVIIADDSTNTFTGTNVYRLLKAEPKSSATKVDGTDISDQKKRYKMDGAFYSFMSLAMGGGTKANGILNVKSTTYEGLDVETHMTLESGVVNVDAVDDGMNFNEDDISVFTMLGGTLTVSSQNGDGIDSNGYAYINGGTLNITAGSQKINSAGEAGLDVEKSYEVTSNATYNWTAASGGNGGNNPPENIPSTGLTITTTSLADGTVGVYYSQTLSASSSARWSLTKGVLPDGLTLSPLGTIQGNPTTVETQTFTLTASADAGSASKEFTLKINAASDSAALAITSSATINATVNSSISFTFTANLSGVTWSASNLPSGLSLNSSTGALTGSLASEGTYRFSVTASLDEETATQNVVLTVTPKSTSDDETETTETVEETTITTDNGTTTVKIGTESVTPVADTDTSPRGIATSDNVFRIRRKVNTFSGITEE